MSDGRTEEKLSIVAALQGDKKVGGGLAAMAAEADRAARNRTSTVTYDDRGSLTNLTRKAQSFHSVITRTNSTLRSGVMGIRGAFMGLVGVPAIFAAIVIAIQALPGLLSVVTGGVAALGVGFTAFGAVAITTLIGLNGVFSAITEGREATAQATAEADRYANALRAVEAASRNVTSAQKDAVRAQKSLSDAEEKFRGAPKQAAEQIADARTAAARATLDEEAAVLRLQEAQKNLSELQKNVGKSTLSIIQQTDTFTGKIVEQVTKSSQAISGADIKGAQLEVKQAELALAEARKNTIKSQEDLNEKVRDGIEGSDVYKDSLDALRDAQDRLADSQQRVQDAQRAVTDAQKDAVPQTTAFQKAMAKLTPEGRTFVTFVNDRLIPTFMSIRDAVQRNMLPGVQSGLQVLVDNTDGLSDGFGRLGKATGDSFNEFMQYWGKPENKGILTSLVDVLAGPDGAIASLSRVLAPLSSILVQVITAATPLFNTLMAEFGTWLDSMDANLKNGGAGALTDWFSHLAGPITNTFGLLGDFASALTPLTTQDGFFNQLITDLRTDFIPAFRDLVTAVGDSNLAEGMVGVLTTVTEFLTWLVKVNDATGNGLLYAILGVFASSAFLTGVQGFAGVLSGLGLMGGGKGILGGLAGRGAAAAGTSALGGAAAALGGAAAGTGAVGATVSTAGIAAAVAAALAAVGQTVDSYGKWQDHITSGNFSASYNKDQGLQLGAESARTIGGGIARTNPLIALLQTGFDAFFPQLGTDFRTATDDISGNFVNTMMTWGTKDIPNFMSETSQNFASLAGNVGSNFDMAANGAKDGFGQAANDAGRALQGAADGGRIALEGAANGTRVAWDGVTRGVGTIWESLMTGDFATTWSGMVTGAGQIWNGVTEGVRIAWEGVTGGIRYVFEQVTSGIGDGFKSIINGFITTINGVIGLVNLLPGPDFPTIKLIDAPMRNVGKRAADGDTVPGGGSYRDKVPYLLAPGEEIISNRQGQADRHRGLLKSINNGSYDGNPSGVDIDALVEAILKATRNVNVDVTMEDKTSVDELSKELAWRLR